MHRQQLIVNIVDIEWTMFTSAQSEGGRADCQDDLKTFIIMRSAQFSVWGTETLESYYSDLLNAASDNINLMTIKYARMMEYTHPDEYEQLCDLLPPVDEEAESLVRLIAVAHTKWTHEINETYPVLSKLCRPADYNAALDSGVETWAAQDNYLHSELLTYSVPTLRLCVRDVEAALNDGVNLAFDILRATVSQYGYESLDEAETMLARL